jgi:integrase
VHGLSKDELRRLLSTARAARERDWLMILVAFNHGLRASEVTGFTRDAVEDGHLTVQRLKGSLKTSQALIESADPLFDERRALIEYARKSTPGWPVFKMSRQHFWRLVQRYAHAAGIPKRLAHPHILKHTIALQTIHSAGIENVRQHLGHKSLSSTGEYLRVTDDEAGAAIARALRSDSIE